MKIKHISAHNIKAFENFEVEPGEVNVCAGTNASGKTSVLSLVVGLFGKGNAKMLRPGAESGEIRATIEDDETGETFTVTRTFEPGKVKPTQVKSSKVGKLGAPATWISSVLDEVCIDPVNVAMKTSDARQAEILLETVPLPLDFKEVKAAIAGVEVDPAIVKNAEKMASALDAIAAVRGAIYSKRTDVNRDADTLAKHAAQLRESLPKPAADGEGKSWKQIQGEAKKEIDRIEAGRLQARTAAKSILDRDRDEVRVAADNQKDAVNARINAQIALLEAERNDVHRTIAANAQERVRELTDAHATKLQDIDKIEADALAAANELHAQAGLRIVDEAQSERTKQIIEETETKALAAADKAKGMTEAIEKLDGVREALLEKLPIKRLKVENGIAYLDGVPLSERNTAEQVLFWLRIGAMRAKDLGIACADGLECLDDATFAKVLKALPSTGVQWFCGRVDSRPFRVERYDGDGNLLEVANEAE